MNENSTGVHDNNHPAPQPPTIAELERREAELAEARQAAEARIRELEGRLEHVRAAELAVADERAAYARRLAAGDDDAGGAADFDERARVEALRREGLEALLAEARAHLEEIAAEAREVSVPLGRLRLQARVNRHREAATTELDVMRRRYRDLAAAFGRFAVEINELAGLDRNAAQGALEALTYAGPSGLEEAFGGSGRRHTDPLLGPLVAEGWKVISPAIGDLAIALRVSPMVPPAPAEQATP